MLEPAEEAGTRRYSERRKTHTHIKALTYLLTFLFTYLLILTPTIKRYRETNNALDNQFNDSVGKRHRAQSFIIVTLATDLPLRTILLCCLGRNVEAHCHKHFVVVSREKTCKRRRLPATSVINLQRSVAAVFIALGSRTVELHAMQQDIG